MRKWSKTGVQNGKCWENPQKGSFLTMFFTTALDLLSSGEDMYDGLGTTNNALCNGAYFPTHDIHR